MVFVLYSNKTFLLEKRTPVLFTETPIVVLTRDTLLVVTPACGVQYALYLCLVPV